MVPFQVSSPRRSSSVPHSLSPPFSCLHPWRVAWCRWELSMDGLVVLLGVHGVGQGAGQCGVDVFWGEGRAAGEWRRGWVLFAGVPRSGPRWLRGIGGGVAWGGRVPAVPWLADGRVGAGPWLPVGVGWPGGRHSRRPTGSGLQRTSCRASGGTLWLRCCGAVYNRVGDMCG